MIYNNKHEQPTLVNAEERAENSPNFEIPNLEDRASLHEGDFVQVILEGVRHTPHGTFGGERPWVRVTEVDQYETGVYVGEINSDMFVYTEFKPGDEIDFCSHHVISIMQGDQ